MDWHMSEILNLINLYRQFECLWNYQSSCYKRVDMKRNAWTQISQECGRNVDDVKKKIKNLRSAYVMEKKKVDNIKKSGSSADALYEPHLFYFSEMSFLDSVVVLRKTSSNIDSQANVEIAVECLEKGENPMNETLIEKSTPSPSTMPIASARSSQSSMPSPTPSTSSSFPSSSASASTSSVSRRRRNRGSCNDAKFDKAIEAIVSSATKPEVEDVFTSFAKTIAKQLEQLPLITATETMSEIHCIVTRKVIEHLAASQQQLNWDSEQDIVQMALSEADISF